MFCPSLITSIVIVAIPFLISTSSYLITVSQLFGNTAPVITSIQFSGFSNVICSLPAA